MNVKVLLLLLTIVGVLCLIVGRATLGGELLPAVGWLVASIGWFQSRGGFKKLHS